MTKYVGILIAIIIGASLFVSIIDSITAHPFVIIGVLLSICFILACIIYLYRTIRDVPHRRRY